MWMSAGAAEIAKNLVAAQPWIMGERHLVHPISRTDQLRRLEDERRRRLIDVNEHNSVPAILAPERPK